MFSDVKEVVEEKVNTEIIEANAKELSDLTIQLLKGDIDAQKFENSLLEWTDRNKNFHKALEVATGIANTAAKYYGAGKLARSMKK